MTSARRRSAKQLAKTPCFRCGEPSKFQWTICSLGQLWYPCCSECDIDLNRLVLEWADIPDRENIIKSYTEYVNKST